MKWEILLLSPGQIDKIIEYMLLTERPSLPDPDTQFEEFKSQVIQYLFAIEAFGNDPKKAAAYWNAALEKARREMDNVCERMLAHIPKPIKKHYYACFETTEEANAYMKKVGDEAQQVHGEILQKEFYGVCQEYRTKQLGNQQPLH